MIRLGHDSESDDNDDNFSNTIFYQISTKSIHLKWCYYKYRDKNNHTVGTYDDNEMWLIYQFS
jgi:hypothetical protein